MNQTARQARAMSRRVPPDRVLYIELTEFIMNTDPGVRQSERMDDMPNVAGSGGESGSGGGSGAGGAPLELIAASLRRGPRPARPSPPPAAPPPRGPQATPAHPG